MEGRQRGGSACIQSELVGPLLSMNDEGRKEEGWNGDRVLALCHSISISILKA